MMLSSLQLAGLLKAGEDAQTGKPQTGEAQTGETQGDDPLIITPTPDLDKLRSEPTASVNLRLGTWFLSLRQTRLSEIGATANESTWSEGQIAKSYYVPFGEQFVLHPGSFVLAATLEWIRLPRYLAAYVVGRSSWGRTGLIIATAVGVHPGFTGCLTLELCNAGEIPIRLDPGAAICQLFMHNVGAAESDPAIGAPRILPSESNLNGSRRPRLGPVQLDPVALKLARRFQDQRQIPLL